MALSPFMQQAARDLGRFGTVHTAQGRESPIVVLCLGSNPSNLRAIKWAGSTANLLNVAASRAKDT